MKNKQLIVSLVVLVSLLLTSHSGANQRKAERFITKNGMTILLLERDSLPFITVNVSIRAGSVFETAEKAGLASITADLLTEGTQSRSSSQISEEIDFIGGSLGSSGGIDYASASMKVLTKDSDKGFNLLADILRRPSFSDMEIDRSMSQIKAGIISKEDDPSTVAAEAFNKALFGDHPYARPAEGTLESLENIGREDIINFHNKLYRPNNVIMAVVGDINKRSLKKLLKKHFGNWEKKTVPLPEPIKAQQVKGRKVEFINKKISQANVQLGHIGIKRENPDFYAAYVMNYILGGGGFVSRLMTEIRDNRGLVYSVYSYFNPMKDPGPFKIGLQTKSKSAREAIEESLAQMENMKKNGVTEEELRGAKDYLIGSFPLRFTTNAKIASYLSYMEYNLGLDYLDKFPKIIDALTLNDINRAAKKYLHPENYLLIVVGDKGEIGKL
jgi:zinc protease